MPRCLKNICVDMSLPGIEQVAFSKIKGITPETAGAILAVVGSEAEFFRMSERELAELASAGSHIFAASYREGLLCEAEKELDFVARNGIRCLYFRNQDYPARFQNVPDAPLLIYAKGDTDLNARCAVGIVGTRHATVYGQKLTRDLVAGLGELVGKDVVVVSGLAYGVDVAAHLAALECGMPTVAVMAHGLDMIYPAQHRSVAADIVRRRGAVTTEYGCRTRVHRSNFLARNRIIAALSDCTVVVESAFKGGALVTAKVAQNYGRDVFAFPGRVGDVYSEGCNTLIRKNVAALATSASDVVDMMRWERSAKPVEKSLFIEYTKEEQAVVDCLQGRDLVQINELSALLKMPVHKLLNVLFELEFKGAVSVMPGNCYRLV